MTMFRRQGDIVHINGEVFDIQDLLSVFPNYLEMGGHAFHLYDGKRHYVSDGRTQTGLEVPYLLGEQIFHNIAQIRLCKRQRETDERHIEHLRAKRQG